MGVLSTVDWAPAVHVRDLLHVCTPSHHGIVSHEPLYLWGCDQPFFRLSKQHSGLRQIPAIPIYSQGFKLEFGGEHQGRCHGNPMISIATTFPWKKPSNIV